MDKTEAARWTRANGGYEATIAGHAWRITRDEVWLIFRGGVFCTARETLTAAKHMAETDHLRAQA